MNALTPSGITTSGTRLGLAAAVALVALASAATGTMAEAKTSKVVACYGINACKGQSDCKSGNHDCKGLNDCKGQGFKDTSAKACATAGGSLTAPK
ncbi:BufA2 family periplasmic bufferin-type metallophore [Novosphingobium pituita]|jgi:uncharacterized membrane protein|uniref:Integral membrane protein n=1 Tax=Novosphingobium pituita TaxID=3056842 RepID=A0ABQ6PBC6_9SPHN|nr:hypothetical protein [Novosphingobium sp. IK01]MDK4807426.1 hypothetical protein [Novosphingobium aromaticivorans]GMM61724.1 hypothetical protein NUTIK01_25010 [Novosphingobium sp. IK01]HIQ18980.1 hypothetical protein [Novosphingobium capsulatum]